MGEFNLPVGKNNRPEVLSASSMLRESPQHSRMADAEDVRFPDRRRVHAWGAAGKCRGHGRQDLVRDAWIAPIVDDLEPGPLLDTDGAVSEIRPQEVAVSRAILNRPRRRRVRRAEPSTADYLRVSSCERSRASRRFSPRSCSRSGPSRRGLLPHCSLRCRSPFGNICSHLIRTDLTPDRYHRGNYRGVS